MRSISYSTVADTKENYKTKSNEYYWNRISAIAEDIATKPYSQAYDLIVSSGISGTAATALLRALGKANAVFGYVSILTFIKDYFSLSKYRSAANNGYGMLHAIYQTSYQGKWYSHDAEDSWTTANTVYEPASFYGTGVYEANTK